MRYSDTLLRVNRSHIGFKRVLYRPIKSPYRTVKTCTTCTTVIVVERETARTICARTNSLCSVVDKVLARALLLLPRRHGKLHRSRPNSAAVCVWRAQHDAEEYDVLHARRNVMMKWRDFDAERYERDDGARFLSVDYFPLPCGSASVRVQCERGTGMMRGEGKS
jgi:hypothetical protein